MSLIQTEMPAFDVRQVDHVAVSSDRFETWSAVRRVASGAAFRILGEQPGREVVVAPIRGGEGDAAPRFGLSVEPCPGGGSWLSVEVRAPSSSSDVRALTWLSHALRHAALSLLVPPVLSPLRRGSFGSMPGDDLLPRARLQTTYHVDLDASPAAVWPWLAPRSAGLDGFGALALEPGTAIVLGAPGLRAGRPFLATWTFTLDAMKDDTTRLTTRVRADSEAALELASVRPLVQGLREVMAHSFPMMVGRSPRTSVTMRV